MKAVHKRIQTSIEAVRPTNSNAFNLEALDKPELEHKLLSILMKLESAIREKTLDQKERLILLKEQQSIKAQLETINEVKKGNLAEYFMQMVKEENLDLYFTYRRKAEQRQHYWRIRK